MSNRTSFRDVTRRAQVVRGWAELPPLGRHADGTASSVETANAEIEVGGDLPFGELP
ncbi:hypothetical protein [Lentzea albidocapillata]|uniref:Uncharacterized protein n=1 Tax=Lentzea albidocapillata TaxID=40571 RepID=A0A1W2C0A6_9PSEU|nr:hypothetical protein [Lentzea albidocapillata]SMC78342.1 hypothetical protein SAMN05660733_01673 [Lentzea albidocapillata]